MTSKTEKHRDFFRLNTIFVKCGLAALFALVLSVGTMNVISARLAQNISQSSIRHEAEAVSALMSLQLGGTIKFGNTEAAQQILDSVVEASRPDALGGAVVSASGEILYISENLADRADTIRVVAAQTLNTGELASSADGLTASAPSRFGPDNQLVGAVVTVWTDAFKHASLQKARQDAVLAAIAAGAVALGLFSVFLWRHFSMPLRKMQMAVGAIENGDYTTPVDGQNRGDEIGGIASRLVNFRDALAESAVTQRESAFRGAAFQGSTAAMMLIDENHNVVFANPACAVLLDDMYEAVSKVWPDVQSGQWEGHNLCAFSPLSDALNSVTGQGQSALPLSVAFELGDRHVNVNMNGAFDNDGQMIGAVVEWADTSEGQKNAAVLETVDRKQVRLEFSGRGRCIFANQTACMALDIDAGSLNDMHLTDVFFPDQEDPGLQGDWQSRVLLGNETSGVFSAKPSGSGTEHLFDGGFGVVVSPAGTIERLIFLGTDVSEARRKMREADELREKNSREQELVVTALGAALKSLSRGDLSVSIAQSFPMDYDQLRCDFNAATAALNKAVGLVSKNTDEIRTEATDITTAADELSRRTERQAAALEGVAAALDSITSSVEAASKGAGQANDASILAQRSAEEGGEVARKAVAAMDGIKTSSSEISKITSVIDDIAFQTNLLALNAGVEAARAGEAGRGFAVVATEVRALAQRSSDAASEINVLISSSGDQVKDGVELVDRTGKALDDIVRAVSDITTRVSQIAASSREQATGLNEINTSVVELDQVTQQNAAMFDKTTAASQALTVKADSLSSAVSQFRLSDSPAEPKPVKPDNATRWSEEKAKAPGPEAVSGGAADPGAFQTQKLAVNGQLHDRPSEVWEDF